MKLTVIVLGAFLASPLFAQQPTSTKAGHTEVVEVTGATAQTLKSRATDFMASKRIEPKTVATTVSGIGSFRISYTSVKKGPETGLIKFDMKITVKDGKYKMELTDLRHEGIQGKSAGGPIELAEPECGTTQLSAASWAKIKQEAPEQLKAFAQELKSKMDNPVKTAPASTDF